MPARLERRFLAFSAFSAATSTSNVMISVGVGASPFRYCIDWISQVFMVDNALCDIDSMSPCWS